MHQTEMKRIYQNSKQFIIKEQTMYVTCTTVMKASRILKQKNAEDCIDLE